MLIPKQCHTWSDNWSLRLAANSSANKLYSQLKRDQFIQFKHTRSTNYVHYYSNTPIPEKTGSCMQVRLNSPRG